MVFHSVFNSAPQGTYQTISNIPLMPIKTRVPGVAPMGNPNEEDIIDEALKLFKANVFFKNFEVKGDADRLLIYLTFYIQLCITKVINKPKVESEKIFESLAKDNFSLPGSSNFPLGGICPAPRNANEAEQLRAYLTQCRAELGIRLVEMVYTPDNDRLPSKWWVCFAKRKFLNKSM